jgi:hypothetical protein
VTSSEGSYNSDDEVSDSEYITDAYEYKDFDFDSYSES